MSVNAWELDAQMERNRVWFGFLYTLATFLLALGISQCRAAESFVLDSSNNLYDARKFICEFNGEIKSTDVDIPIDYWAKKAPFEPVLKDWKRDSPYLKSFLTEIIETKDDRRRAMRAVTTFGTSKFESTVRFLPGYVAIVREEDDPMLINIYSLRLASNLERFFALRIWAGKFSAPNMMHTEMEIGFCSAE